MLWSAERVRPGDVQVINVLAPPGELRVTAPLADGRPDEVEVQVRYPKGVSTSFSDLSTVRPGKFALFESGGSSLQAFNAQADEASVCRWYASPIERWWPPLALGGGAALVGGGLLRRRRRARRSATLP